MHIKHLIKESIEKGVPIEDYIKSLDSSHRYYPLINRKNKYYDNNIHDILKPNSDCKSNL